VQTRRQANDHQVSGTFLRGGHWFIPVTGIALTQRLKLTPQSRTSLAFKQILVATVIYRFVRQNLVRLLSWFPYILTAYNCPQYANSLNRLCNLVFILHWLART
jgi:hypothetical protein